MHPETGKRIALDALILISVFLLPWWVGFVLVFIALFAFAAYEAVAAGFMLDVLYAAEPDRYGGFEYIFTLVFLLLLVGYLVARRYFRAS